MMEATVPTTFIDNAKVMAKGQVTIPKDVRKVLGLDSGSRVTFIVEQGVVRMVNSAVYAMQMMQSEMQGEAERSGLTSDEAVNNLVKEIRSEGE
ncbi:MAG: AbrB/MazE/SpoVT family DNA-binding domain-containing protein [Acutalibacteraceae bacterium]|jgi:AbrB family looped-hinge helix DNA binding protein|nr:AbrB/MazE/SpoVT family DNA-binding domain-containing protein [Acutalibacteraceae bacterium]